MGKKTNDLEEQRGYQPKPNTDFGYQPSNSNMGVAPNPPKSGSDAKTSKND